MYENDRENGLGGGKLTALLTVLVLILSIGGLYRLASDGAFRETTPMYNWSVSEPEQTSVSLTEAPTATPTAKAVVTRRPTATPTLRVTAAPAGVPEVTPVPTAIPKPNKSHRAILQQGRIINDFKVTLYKDGTCEIVGYHGAAELLMIPEKIGKSVVTTIGKAAFMDCLTLKTVVLPDSVTMIDEHAFACCSALESVDIPAGVEFIGDYAFALCPELSLIVREGTPAHQYAKDWSIRCQELPVPPSIASPASIKPLIPTATPRPAAKVIQEKDKVVGDYKINLYRNGTCEIIDYTGSAAELEIPAELAGATVTGIGDKAFESCRTLRSVVLPDSVTAIGRQAFYSCDALESIRFPDGLTTIGDNAFSFCELTEISLPETLTSIGQQAFYACEFTEISLPASVINIGEGAFCSHNKLRSITVALENPSWISVDGVLYDRAMETLLCYPSGRKDTQYTVAAGTKQIADEAFVNCKHLKQIDLPEGLTDIGASAFESCSDLISITLPETLVSIGEQAFAYCRDLQQLRIPASVSSFSEDVFYSCGSLTGLTVDEDNPILSAVDGVLFDKHVETLIRYPSNRKAEQYVVPDGVKKLNSFAFAYNGYLSEVILPESLTTIDSFAFGSCDKLTGIILPDSVTTIGFSAFSGCSALQSVVLPRKLKAIDDWLFDSCTSLKSVNIPDGVTSIGYYSFQDCSAMTSIAIPWSVTSIGLGAFDDCPALTLCVFEGSYAHKYAQENNLTHSAD